MAVRHKEWKAHYSTQGAYGPEARKREKHDVPLLYNLHHDPSERFNLNEKYPKVLAEIAKIVEAHRKELKTPASQLEIPLKK